MKTHHVKSWFVQTTLFTTRAVIASAFFFCSLAVHAGTGSIDTGAKTIDLSVFISYNETDDNLDSATVNPDWREVFNDASARLWQATNGQLKIGKVTVYIRALNKKEDADVWILDGSAGAYAHVNKLGQKGYHMTIFQNRHRSTSAAYQGGFSIVHEMGHYVFGLYDQYQGASVPLAKKDTWTAADLSAISKSVNTNSVSATDLVASIMDGGGGVNNVRTEFDTAANINKGVAVGARWWMNEHWIRHKESCWETMAKFKWNGVNVFPDVPAGASPTDVPAGSTAVEWEVVPTLSRLVLCIDRSGSMTTDSRMELAILGASMLTNLTEEQHQVVDNGVTYTVPGDRLAVVDFDDLVTTTFSMTEVDAAGTVRGQARAAIQGLTARGLTAIGSGTQRSLDIITAQGDRVTQEAIILLSDGFNNSGISPATAAANVAARKAKIFSIALGSGADAGTLSSMATTTGGKFYQANNGLGLLDIYTRIYGELRGGGLIESLASLASENTTTQHLITVDELTEEAVFSVASPDTGFNLEIISPKGKKYTGSVPAESIVYVNNGNQVHFRVPNPLPGVWKLNVISPDTDVGATYQYNVLTNSANAKVSISAAPDQASYVYPAPVRITCQVTAGDPVTGASVTVDVTGPNGVLGKMILHDDGSAINGDDQPKDGTYSGFYNAFPFSGTYNFEVSVVNTVGTAATGELEETLVLEKPRKIPAFSRSTTTTAQVAGVPVVDQQWLRVDTLSFARNAKNVNTALLNARFTLNGPQESFTPGIHSLSVRLDSSTLLIPASAFLPTTKPNVFNIKYPTLGVTGSIIRAVGGSSRHDLVLKALLSPATGFDYNTTTSVQVSFGTATGIFNQTVSLTNLSTPSTTPTKITYSSKNNFATSSLLYLDGFNAKVNNVQAAKDTLRAVISYEGAVTFNPATNAMVLDLGGFKVNVPAGTLVANTAGTLAKGTVQIGPGTVSIVLDLAKKLLTVTGAKLNAGGQIQQSMVLGLSMGTFNKKNLISLQATSKSGVTTFIY
jgi:hypothetical protein